MIKEVATNLLPSEEATLRLMAACAMPNEACGIIRRGHIEELSNLSTDPENSFDMELMLGDPSITHLWHSHPLGRQTPSEVDTPHMELLSSKGHHYTWLIVTDLKVRAFEVIDG